MIHPWDWAFFTISMVIGPGGSPASSVPSMSKLTNTANGAPSFRYREQVNLPAGLWVSGYEPTSNSVAWTVLGSAYPSQIQMESTTVTFVFVNSSDLFV